MCAIKGEVPSGPKGKVDSPYDPQMIFEPSPLPSPCPPASRMFLDGVTHALGPLRDGQQRNEIHVVSWNVAAVNNNPFEYWITHDDPAYNQLMEGTQNFLDNPGDRDVAIHQVFTDKMFNQLLCDMIDANIPGLKEVARIWRDCFSVKKIVSGFLKDTEIGKKRLASMPDRITNTINTLGNEVQRRPTVINYYSGDMATMSSWWAQWRNFMFRCEVEVFKGKAHKGPVRPQVVYELLDPILQSKYPAVTAEEEAISIPLQILCLAIFDAVLVHMMISIAPHSWQNIRQSIADAMLTGKERKTAQILMETYSDADVVFLQEAPGSIKESEMLSALQGKFFRLAPQGIDGKRDQNSLVLASRATFVKESAFDITEEVLVTLGQSKGKTKKSFVHGDLIACTLQDKEGAMFLLASFHGDTNGFSTKPIVEAIHRTAEKSYPNHKIVIGLDANTYKVHSDQHQGVHDFNDFLTSEGMSSCWGDHVDPNSPTTCNSRTYLQPQLNKAIGKQDRLTRADKNLKDWVVFNQSQLEPSSTLKDNTGKRHYIDDMVFPTMQFPSDHAIVSTVLSWK
mmetsp:Transcript_55103/g.112683  ORF Transcript_55103/g.112683 Transcript_55103/m.112683 type:complete len:567 (+) Transcript_55103:131-1831(+)